MLTGNLFFYFRTPLSNAERQRRWMERQKQKGEEDLFRKEAKRKRGSYVPVDDLNTSVKKKRREEGRKRSQKWYEKKKNKNTEDNENEHELGSASSSSKTERLVVKLPSHKTERLVVKLPSHKTERLVVKLPSHKTPAKGGFIRNKYRRSLRKTYRQNDELSFTNKQLQRGNKRLQKLIERRKKDKKTRRNETNDDTR
jgi:hypothetical protein